MCYLLRACWTGRGVLQVNSPHHSRQTRRHHGSFRRQCSLLLRLAPSQTHTYLACIFRMIRDCSPSPRRSTAEAFPQREPVRLHRPQDRSFGSLGRLFHARVV